MRFIRISRFEGTSEPYTLGGSLLDLLFLAAIRLVFALLALLISYCKGEIRPEYPFNLFHKNGIKKSREELEEEALEQSFFAWLSRYVSRPSFLCEFTSMTTMIVCIIKSLVRFDLEIGKLADSEPVHPLIWCAILFSTIIAVLEMCIVDNVSLLVGEWGHVDRDQENPTFLRQISSSLNLPLLQNDSLGQDEEEGTSTENAAESASNNENAAGVSDIGADSTFKASWKDLLRLCAPDAPLICIAFIFLLLAAAAQIYIPRFTGDILDKLTETFTGDDDDDDGGHKSMSDVPGFMSNVRKLIAASILGGVFSGIRGSIFTAVGGRVVVRLRMMLMDSIMVQGRCNKGLW